MDFEARANERLGRKLRDDLAELPGRIQRKILFRSLLDGADMYRSRLQGSWGTPNRVRRKHYRGVKRIRTDYLDRFRPWKRQGFRSRTGRLASSILRMGLRGVPRNVVGVQIRFTGAARKYAHITDKGGKIMRATFVRFQQSIVREMRISTIRGLRFERNRVT